MKYSKVFFKGLILLLFLAVTSCQKTSSENSKGDNDPWNKPGLSDTPVEGFINGRAWKFSSGKAISFRHRDKDVLIISLWSGERSDPCNEVKGSDFQTRIQVLAEVNRWELDSQDPFKNYPLLIFSDLTSDIQANHNMVASAGEIQILKIEKSRVIGKIYGLFPGNSVGKTELLGAFAVPFCGSR